MECENPNRRKDGWKTKNQWTTSAWSAWFKDHVGRVSVKAIIRAAKERRPGALGYAEAMILEYNKKSKYRLSLRTLYGGKPVNSEDDFVEE